MKIRITNKTGVESICKNLTGPKIVSYSNTEVIVEIEHPMMLSFKAAKKLGIIHCDTLQ